MPSLERVRSGPRCSVCAHPKRRQIETALIGGAKKADVEREFGLGREAVRGHIRRHLPGALEKAFDARELVLAKTLEQRVSILLVECADVLEAAREGLTFVECPGCKHGFDVRTNNVRDRVGAIGVVQKNLELLGRLSGKLGGASELFARLGVRDEDQLRQMLQVARANVNMSEEDHILNGIEILVQTLPGKPEMIEEARRRLEAVLKKPALPAHANGNSNGGEA